MDYLKSFRFLVLIILLNGVFSSCKTSNVLNYNYNPFYVKDNPRLDSFLIQGVFLKFSKPDRGSWPGLQFELLDSSKANSLRFINLVTDTSVIKCSYYRLCYCDRMNEDYTISGTVEILKWNYKKIKLRENILINDRKRNEIIRYKGTCKFIRRKEQ